MVLDSDVYLNDKNIMKQMVKKIINGKDALGGEAILNNQDEIVEIKAYLISKWNDKRSNLFK